MLGPPLKVPLLLRKVRYAFVLAAKEETQIENNATGDNLSDHSN